MSTRLRLVFMGTPAFAAPTLHALIDSGAYDIVGVVTQPDAPAGRSGQATMSPVKRLALAHGLPVLQPARIRRAEAAAVLRTLRPDVQIVAAFGQILPRAVLDIPPLGTLNVHASLLPRWRGAAPVAAAILAGDAVTGVTIMRLDEGMDTGDILARAETPSLPDDTTASLTARLADMGAQLLLNTLPRWARGEITPAPQDGSQATVCKPLRKEDGLIDWRLPAPQIARAVRAYNPWPGSYTFWNGRQLKIVAARVLGGAAGDKQPGTVVSTPQGAAVVTGEGLLQLEQLQLEGKRALPAADFLRGQRSFLGSRLGKLDTDSH